MRYLQPSFLIRSPAVSCLLLTMLVFIFGNWSVGFAGTTKADSRYSYISGQKKITLNPSSNLLLVDDSNSTKKEFHSKSLAEIGIILDPLSQKTGLKKSGLKLYRRTKSASDRREKGFKSLVKDKLNDENIITQPVFEQGEALLIPGAEIIVTFKGAADIEQQLQLLNPLKKELGISNIQAAGGNSLLLTIDQPDDGRCYQVCRKLTQLNKVASAEPNHLIIMLSDQESRQPAFDIRIAANPESQTLLSPAATLKTLPADDNSQTNHADDPTNNDWQLLAKLDAEEETYPPPGWSLTCGKGKTTAAWGRTDQRAFAGNHSLYCAAYGPSAVSAPGPAPVNMAGYLFSPALDLSSFNEVYVEVWFYAKNEILRDDQNQPQARDLPVIGITDGKKSCEKYLTVVHSQGDCTSDPTTKKGWRKCLFRIPPAFHSASVKICFLYLSDGENPKEGCYLDNIRIVASKTLKKDASLGDDPYCGAQYELVNHGQIAGLGTPDNDMNVTSAWTLTEIDKEVVVAVIDDGVELEHPDLNLVQGYRPDGSNGGGPMSEDANHGTSVAGNIGAIGNNNIGIIGIAPNVKIMPINGGTSVLERAAAIRLAVSKGAKIINNSWGWVGAPSPQIENAIADALRAGVVVLFAAGNGPDRPPFTYDVAFPGYLTENYDLICVGATSLTDEHKSAASSDGEFGWGSSYIGPGPDICAPGPWSYTTDRLGKLGYNNGSSGINPDYCTSFGGTSSSCPKVAGVVALMLSANPRLTPAEVKDILMKSADDIDAPGFDDKTGAGRVNAFKAVQMAQLKLNPTANPEKNQEIHNDIPRSIDAFSTPGQNHPKTLPARLPKQNNWQSVVE